LREDGAETLALPLRERRKRLERFARGFAPDEALRLIPATSEREVVDGWFARVGGALDGVIAKRAGMPYGSGKRDAAVKIKKTRTGDCVIGPARHEAGALAYR
jgi:ATP-dependent DNA ligase